ncbi:MAG: glycosyltransferase, partial [Omnitrophica WOR_2 bacterium]
MSRVTMIISNAFRPDPRLLNEACSMAEAGHQVNIVGWDRACEKPQTETLENGIRVYRIQSVRSGYGLGASQLRRVPRYWLALYSTLNRLKPEIVHCHDFDTLPGGLWWGKLHRKPVIYDAREYYAELVKPRLHGLSGKLLYRFIGAAERYCARQASAVITVDENLGAIYRRFNRRVIIVGHYPPLRMVGAPAPVFTRPELHMLYAGRLSADRGL